MMFTAKMAHFLFYIGDMVEQSVKRTNLEQVKKNFELDEEAKSVRQALFKKFEEDNLIKEDSVGGVSARHVEFENPSRAASGMGFSSALEENLSDKAKREE